MFKNLFAGLRELRSNMKDEKKKNDILLNVLTSKKLFIFGMSLNVLGLAYFMSKGNDSNLDFSMSRYLSRKVGKIGDITIPTFMRKSIYSGYMKMYNINKEEILDQNLENYKTIKEFFIRKIDVKSKIKFYIFLVE
jgi:hypothetical protein